jgi:hypothetical protein
MRRRLICIVIAGLLIAPLVIAAQGAGDKTDDAQQAQAADVELLAEAHQLAETGQKLKVPEAYVAAGRLLLRLQKQTGGKLGKIDAEPKIEDDDGNPIKGAKAEVAQVESLEKTADNFFGDALALAVEQKNVEPVRALIKAVKDDPGGASERGAIGGPKLIARVIPPRQTHVWAIAFDTHSMAAVGFQATAPCRCRMVNQNGHEFFDQTVRSGKFVWQPRGKSHLKGFMVTVHNPHKAPVTYRLFTN